MRNKEKNWSKDINLKATAIPHKTRSDWAMVQIRDLSKLYQPKIIFQKERVKKGKTLFGQMASSEDMKNER